MAMAPSTAGNTTEAAANAFNDALDQKQALTDVAAVADLERDYAYLGAKTCEDMTSERWEDVLALGRAGERRVWAPRVAHG